MLHMFPERQAPLGFLQVTAAFTHLFCLLYVALIAALGCLKFPVLHQIARLFRNV